MSLWAEPRQHGVRCTGPLVALAHSGRRARMSSWRVGRLRARTVIGLSKLQCWNRRRNLVDTRLPQNAREVVVIRVVNYEAVLHEAG